MSSVGSGSSTVEFLIAFSVVWPVEVEYWLTVISHQKTLVCGRQVHVLS